ncbi:MAG: hypothetical protein NC905_07385 [Candidatus Omnitrophica bacterium]|nr:hypothetical protein [Candidatus Omnitrophota bacterium]
MRDTKYEDILVTGLFHACKWLTEIAQKKEENLIPEIEKDTQEHRQKTWKGCIRGEYSPHEKKWDFFCPIWHTGQAIKSLVLAYHILKDEKLLDAARLGADFIVKNRIEDRGDDYGLILAFEDFGNLVNVSAILEALDGLIYLYDTTGDMLFLDVAKDACEWIERKTYINGEGLFHDVYSPETQEVIKGFYEKRRPYIPLIGRPLIDDGIFLKLAERCNNASFRKIFYDVAERLIKEEEPPGNWIKFVPCNPQRGNIHPRHAYWWGRPFVMAYRDTKEEKYLQMAKRSAEWYINAQRKDGGIFRNTYRDFKTDSFGHATSGSACAVIFFIDLYEETEDKIYLEPIYLGLDFCLKMQILKSGDPNMKGVIIEKVLPPDGTDGSPYHIRDLGTIFFIQAVSRVLANKKLLSMLKNLYINNQH